MPLEVEAQLVGVISLCLQRGTQWTQLVLYFFATSAFTHPATLQGSNSLLDTDYFSFDFSVYNIYE